MTDQDLELLDSSLDGELSPAESEQLRLRLEREPALAAGLESLRADRDLRESFFASIEPDDASLARILSATRSAIRRNHIRHALARTARWASAIAACVIVGLGAFWISRNDTPIVPGGGQASASPLIYNVSITDESGNVMAIQKFDSLEQAREFTRDLDQWQQRQEQLRNGQITVRSAQF